MSNISITKIGDFNFAKKLKKLERAKVDMPLLIGNITENHFKDGFVKGGGSTDENIGGWKKRKFLKYTRKGKVSSTNNSAILVNSGKLKRSIRIIKKNWKEIIVGSRGLRYASIHNRGGVIKQVLTNKQIAFFGFMYGYTKQDYFLKMAKSRTITIDIPKRQFIGNSRVLSKKIHNLIKREFKKIMS